LSCKSSHSRAAHLASPSASATEPAIRMPFCCAAAGALRRACRAGPRRRPPPTRKQSHRQGNVAATDEDVEVAGLPSLGRYCFAHTAALSRNALAITVPSRLRAQARCCSGGIFGRRGFLERNGTMGSTDRPPNAFSERFTSTRCSLSIRESQRAVVISVIRRPVKVSAKSATCGGAFGNWSDDRK